MATGWIIQTMISSFPNPSPAPGLKEVVRLEHELVGTMLTGSRPYSSKVAYKVG